MSPSRTILYPIELEIKDTTDTDSSASYLDLHLEIKDTTDTDRSASYLDLHLEIKDTTDTDRSASYFDLHLEIDNEGRSRTKLYDKRDDINFPIVNFPFICSNIPSAPAYGVYISQ